MTKPKILHNPLFQKLLSLNLPTADYAIFGSGPMFPVGLKKNISDLDLIAKGEAWHQVQTLGKIQTPFADGHQVVKLFDGEIEVFHGWGPGDWNINELINSAEIYEGIRFVRLESVLAWKKLLSRPKDIPDIQKIEDYLLKT